MAEGDSAAGGRTPPGCLLPEWRQGDCVVGPRPFYYWSAATAEGGEGEPPPAGAGDNIWKEEMEGLVVLTQSCDIERDVSTCMGVKSSPMGGPATAGAPEGGPESPTGVATIGRGLRDHCRSVGDKRILFTRNCHQDRKQPL